MVTRRLVSALTVLSFSAWRGYAAGKFDLSRSDNVVMYWGQLNMPLSDVCKNDDVDMIPMGFMTTAEELPGRQGTVKGGSTNFAGNCNGAPFSGTGLLECHELGQDIKNCQAAGKVITLSIGGATGNITFSSEDEAKSFAEDFYNNFLGGNSSTRPFGDAVLDGIDLDIEMPSLPYLATFVNHVLDYAKQQKDTKKYYVTGAPQCPCPDQNMQEVLAGAPFDAVFVQFYNNPGCQLTQDVDLSKFNFGEWFDYFTKNATMSLNKDTKIYVGAPGSRSAAGSGYVDSATLAKYIDAIRTNSTSSAFGGMMFWDAPSVAQNTEDPNFLQNVKKALAAGGAEPSATSGSASASATGVSNAPSVTGTATGTAPDSTSTVSDASSSADGSAAPTTSGSANGPVSTTSDASASQTTSQASTPSGGSGDDSDCDDEDGDENGNESLQAAGPTTSATATSAALASATCTPPPADCAGVPDWQKTAQYQKCANVRYQGQVYQAASWVTSNEPGTIDVWTLVGTCPDSSAGSSVDPTTPSSTESIVASSTQSSTASVELSTDSSAASSTAGKAASSFESPAFSSHPQPERRLFGVRARHAE